VLADQLAAEGRRPYIVPYGVSNALGAIGYATAIVEIAHQSAGLGFAPQAIVHGSGSGGTQAGLVLGGSLAMPATAIIGIDIDAEPDRVCTDVERYGSAAAEMLGVPFSADCVEVIAGHAGPAYGIPHAATIEAMRLAGRLEALVLDPVYSAKGLAGLILDPRPTLDVCRRHRVHTHRRSSGAVRLPQGTGLVRFVGAWARSPRIVPRGLNRRLPRPASIACRAIPAGRALRNRTSVSSKAQTLC
jgi:Pyridoxal-phosphate dependent enzyme